MKITIVNSYDLKGGAAIAAYRLFCALNDYGITTNYLVRKSIQYHHSEAMYVLDNSPFKEKLGFSLFALEKLHFLFHERSKEVRFAFSTGFFGRDISKHQLIREADVIHLHWFNQGFLSLRNLRKLGALGKPIVWTLHDMWAFTGGCHQSGECRNYEEKCGNCPFLRKPASNDLSNRVWQKKQAVYQELNLHVVTPSNWLAECARKSSLLKDRPIEVIPNPIDPSIFRPLDKETARKELQLTEDKWLIAFVAEIPSQANKGALYLQHALDHLASSHPHLQEQVELLVIGNVKQDVFRDFAFPVHLTGFIDDQGTMARYYSAANVFVLPSLYENLPNTIMEALSSGTPSVAFDVGGIKDLIDHQETGYLAEYASAEDLAQGIHWCIEDQTRHEKLSENAHQKVITHFSKDIVAQQYLDLYRQIIR